MKKLFYRHGYCFAIVPPLLVLGLGSLLFGISAPAFLSEIVIAFHSMINETHEHDLTIHFAEVRARYIWLSTVCLNLIIPLYAITICAVIIYQVPLRHQLKSLLTIGSVLIALGRLGLPMRSNQKGLFTC